MKKKTKYETKKLPQDIAAKYVKIALKENDSYKNLSELTKISDTKLRDTVKNRPKGKLSLVELDKLSIHSTFNLTEAEEEVVKKYPEWKEIIKL